MKKEIGILFVSLGLIALLIGIFFGCLGAFQFVYPDFLKEISFVKIRPLHVSLVVAWIFLCSIGGIYYYINYYCETKLWSARLPKIHLWIFVLTGVLILVCYFMGRFGGREYWEFPAILSIPIFISWMLFGINYFKSAFKKAGNWPVYMWMWATGIVFFFITFSESYLWLAPYFRNNLIRDLTVQWKAYGALVGSWNMLVYGTALFVMTRIIGDEKIAQSRLAFFMYFLGFANLLFGWAHHIYIVPSAIWVRMVSYFMSMTELLILGKIIWSWKNSLSEAKRNFHILPYRFIVASDVWVFLNLALALAISVPAINIYTHGTHVTVAHAMGSTIGINTIILLASAFFLITDITKHEFTRTQKILIKIGFWIFNFYLMVFWVCLIIAGIEKGILVIDDKLSFQEIMTQINPILTVLAFSGIGIFIGLILIVYPMLIAVYNYLMKKEKVQS
ncbi:MAG: cbb3-type cytochrome c oxidase subunit I [Bacteroidetes bacterium]|nr:cbb3-type cytochrome c oxidase subunit I [Bacteroidota bacterium]